MEVEVKGRNTSNSKSESKRRWLDVFCPDYYHECVFDLDVAGLRERGVRGLILDLDNTMIPRKSWDVPDDLRQWIAGLSEAGLGVCVVSNNFAARVAKLAGELGVPLVARAQKPRRRAFQLGMERLGTTAEETAVVGDQLFTDVLGAKRAGLTTVLVVPLTDNELLHTAILRRLERVILRKLEHSRGLLKS